MALIRIQYCQACAAEKRHINGVCDDCRERKHREAMAAWQAKSIDERLLDIHKRLLRLERGPTRY